MKIIRIVAVLALIVFVGAASAAKPPPGSGDPIVLSGGGLDSPAWVEQQSVPFELSTRAYCADTLPTGTGCVYNLTGCAWTADDVKTFLGYGTMPGGWQTTANQCLIADLFAHINGIDVQSSSPNLVVTLSFEPQGVTWTLPARPSTWNASGYEYKGCIVGPFYADNSQLDSVPDSNGGYGIHTDITVTVANPGGSKLRDVSAKYVLGSNEPGRRGSYCQGGDTGETFVSGGALWRTGI